MNKKPLAVIIPLALTGAMWATPSLASGYVFEPSSRNFLCKKGENKNCERAPTFSSDFIVSTSHIADFPKDGNIPGGGVEDFKSLNSETEGLWEKKLLNKGTVNISWQLTSPVKVVSWKYYMTQADWRESLNAEHQLTRESFAAKPFCEVKGDAEKALQGMVTHPCQLPERDGYQVIYAIADLAADAGGTHRSIYNVIDVDIANVTVKNSTQLNTQWKKEIATIDRADNNGPVSVTAGDVIRARFFSHEGELVAKEVRLAILPGEESEWSYHLANAINNKYQDIRAGVIKDSGDVVPANDEINNIFVRDNSQLIRAEVSFN